MEIPLLNDVAVIFGLAVGVLLICHKLRVPTVVGFLVTGVVVGPHALGLVKAVHQVEMIAEVGVVLLLFTIGMEFSLERLLRIKRAVLGGGMLQVTITTALTALFGMQAGLSPG
jgi:CPA2 family monovalent cation:H+ antiporter-2